MPRHRCSRAAIAAATVLLALTLVELAFPPVPAAAQDSVPYRDTRADAYYAQAVGALALEGVFAGTDCDAGFCPDEPIDRATMAVWTVRVLDVADPEPVASTRFADVDASHPHAAFIERFAGLGVTRGCEDGSVFCPDGSVTRAQMAVFLSRGFGLEEGPDPGFSDVPADAWYAADVARLAASGITRGCGDGTRFCADQPTTRAQMAVFLARATGLIDAPTLASRGGFKAVSAGGAHTCAIRTDGTVTCWGDNAHGQADPPPGTYESVSAGGTHTCAMRTDGTVECWGRNLYGQSNHPEGVHRAVTAGDAHTCAIRADGTIRCWGISFARQPDRADGEYIAVAAGALHACAVGVDGTISCWGENDHGQAEAPPGTYRAIAAGQLHACAIRSDDTVVCWGASWEGHGQTDTPEGAYRAVTAGGYHACAIRADDMLACWGASWAGQLTAPRGHFIEVTAGDSHSCGLHRDGSITCWGSNYDGESDVPDLLITNPLWARVTSGSAPVIGVDGSFDVTVEFARWVRDFDTDDIGVVNGTVTSLSGSGSEYRATVQPAAPGTVVVRVRQGAARDRRGARSDASPPMTRTATNGGSAPRVGIDTWDRNAVLAAYEAEFGRVEPDAGFTGDVDGCAAGTTSQPFRDSILQRVNWYRKMAGLAAVTEDPALTATAQRKALIMLAQAALSHTPSADWACFTEIDYPGENIGLGGAGVRGVDWYMQDSGDNNLKVGHRQQILSPFVTQIGTGNVFDSDRPSRAANAMHLFYDWHLAPDVREVRGFVAWPPPGYVPPETVWGRWSFARQRIATEVTRSGNITYTRLFLSGPDFSEAAVAMSDDYGPVPTRIIHRDDGLVWAVDGDTDSARLAEPRGGDYCYTVKVSGVQVDSATQASYEYAVCVLDDDAQERAS